MADVSKIKVPNGAIYNIKDETARTSLASKAEAKHTHTEYALKSKYGDTTINVGRKADTTVGSYSTAEGDNTTAIGYGSHAEGSGTTANGSYSHAEGVSVYTVTNAIPDFSNTTSDEDIINVWNKKPFNLANDVASHSEGRDNLALGIASHAEGYKTIASGENSHTGGHGTKALHLNEVAYGKYNVSNDDTLFSIGDGTADSARHNAFEITTTGGKLHDKNIATLDNIPTSLPANGGNADTIGGKSASDFVEALPLSQSVNSRIKIPDNVDAANWLIENAKIGTMYYRDPNSQGQTNLPPVANISWAWISFDGNNYFARVMIDNYSTRDFLLNQVNFVGGWKEISTTPIKSEGFIASTDPWSHIQLFSSSENKTPLAVIFEHPPRMYSVFVYDGYYYLELYNTSMQTIPNTSVSFVLYYVEV